MEKYVLTRKELKGGKYLYTVTDETGQVISTRKSKRDYVACTIYGDFYFGRLDLIGSGEHGARLTRARAVMTDPHQAYEKWISRFVLSYRETARQGFPEDKWIREQQQHAQQDIARLTPIVYLKK